MFDPMRHLVRKSCVVALRLANTANGGICTKSCEML